MKDVTITKEESDMAKDILAKVAQTTGIPKDHIVNGSRKHDVVFARMLYANILLENGMHIEKLQFFIPKDRSTFYYYREQHNNMMLGKTDIDYYYRRLYSLATMSIDSGGRTVLILIKKYIEEGRIDKAMNFINLKLKG